MAGVSVMAAWRSYHGLSGWVSRHGGEPGQGGRGKLWKITILYPMIYVRNFWETSLVLKVQI